MERKGDFLCVAFPLCYVMRMGLEFPLNRLRNGGSGEMTCPRPHSCDGAEIGFKTTSLGF